MPDRSSKIGNSGSVNWDGHTASINNENSRYSKNVASSPEISKTRHTAQEKLNERPSVNHQKLSQKKIKQLKKAGFLDNLMGNQAAKASKIAKTASQTLMRKEKNHPDNIGRTTLRTRGIANSVLSKTRAGKNLRSLERRITEGAPQGDPVEKITAPRRTRRRGY